MGSLFVGRLPSDIRKEELEDIFAKYGKVNRCDVKKGAQFNFAFVEFEDKKDAEDAVKALDGAQQPEGYRLNVEWAKGTNRTKEAGDGCFKCGETGHWARDCPTGGGGRRGGRDRGDRGGYRDRNRSRSRDRRRSYRSRSRSRSPPRRRRDRSRSRSRRRDSRSPPRSHNRHQSRSPPPAAEKSGRSRSPPPASKKRDQSRSRSPPPPPRDRTVSPVHNDKRRSASRSRSR